MLLAASSTTGAEYKHYEGRITVYVLLTCLLAACGGLMFGYDIGISGMYNKQKPPSRMQLQRSPTGC
jgi:hypothetical protein